VKHRDTKLSASIDKFRIGYSFLKGNESTRMDSI
jgi:hypothetical protein